MRDLSTLRHGEHLTVRADLVPIEEGTFAGVADGYIVIDHDDAYPSKVEIDSKVFDVWDDMGNIVGVVAPDPVLESTIAEME